MKKSIVASAGIASAMLAGFIQVGVFQAPHPAAAQADPQAQIRQEVGTFARLAKELKPSVVNIQVEKVVAQQQMDPQDLFSQFFMQPGRRQQMPGSSQFQPRSHGQGSGVIISQDGFILTNNHVVDGVKTAKVTLDNGDEFTADVVGADPATDLALIRIKANRPLPAAKLGDSQALEVGDWVMAIGNPFGLEETVTVGVLSGKGRVIGSGQYDDYLQTDASINPGNSGGPLFNTSGEVVGINTAIIRDGQGIGFSIPVNMAKEIVSQLRATGKVTRGFLGVGVQPLSPQLRTALGIPAGVKGALVSSLVPGGPASKGGVQVQDVITQVNGKSINSDRELLAEVARAKVGSAAQLSVWRGGHAQTVSVNVSERPGKQVASALPTRPDSADRAQTPALGLVIEPLSPELAQQLSSESSDGVVVIEVAANSPAAQAGLRQGDIIHKVNNLQVHSSQDFVSAVRSSGQSMAFLVEREGSTVFVTLDV